MTSEGVRIFVRNGHLSGNCRATRSDNGRSEEAVPKELLNRLLAGLPKPEDLIGEYGLLKQLTKLLVEKAQEAEMADHPQASSPANRRSTLNGIGGRPFPLLRAKRPINASRRNHGTTVSISKVIKRLSGLATYLRQNRSR